MATAPASDVSSRTPLSSTTAVVAAAAAADKAGSSDATHIFSSGLVQITGLTTLVGGSGLEELSLGLKAAPGLAWSAVSSFGILRVVRAFVAGVVPDNAWRDVLGLRTATVDDALGFNFWTDAEKPVAGGTMQSSVRSAMQQRGSMLAEGRGGVWLCVGKEFNEMLHDAPERVKDHFYKEKLIGWHSAIALSRSLKSTVAATVAFGEVKGIYVHRFIPDDTAHAYRLMDWAMIIASSLKVVEAVTLYRLGSVTLWWSNIIGWAMCFGMAILLQALNSGRDTHSNLHETADFLIGDLPSYQRPGGSDKRIILGQPISVRKNLLWRSAWIVGFVANTVGVAISFYVLVNDGEKLTRVIYVWLAFQVFWVFLRTFAYYIIPEARGVPNVNLTSQRLEDASAISRMRILRLLLITSLLQTHEHVRVYESYLEDIQSMSSPQQLIGVLQQAQWSITDSLSSQVILAPGKARIESVIGEELLRTIVWMTGAMIDNAEIYDAVTILIRAGSGELYLVPGVRVMAGKLIRQTLDPEALGPSFDRPGTVNKGKTGFWVYWLPIENPGSHGYNWLEIQCDPFSVLGALHGHRVLTDAALDRKLAAGTLSIGLRGTADLERALKASRACSQLLLDTVKSLAVGESKERVGLGT